MMSEVKAPNPIPKSASGLKVFLGGSIEMGKAEHWQKRLVKDLQAYDITFLNPRRDDWDPTWTQDPTPGTKFHEQVIWELDMQDQADLIVYYFDPATVSPITLLELGTYGPSKPAIVCCNPKYARYGNVKILCDRHEIPFVETYDDLVSYIGYAVDHSGKINNEWDKWLDSGKVKVMMDNDEWWFAWKEGVLTDDDDHEFTDWWSGGVGPYGRDLLEHVLKRLGIEMEGV